MSRIYLLMQRNGIRYKLVSYSLCNILHFFVTSSYNTQINDASSVKEVTVLQLYVTMIRDVKYE
jgi:hypothetical protein